MELRLQKVLLQLGNEITIFERIMYKNTNQHRRALYFRRLFQVRRDLRLLKSARLTELVQNSMQCLRSTSNESSLSSGMIQSKKTSSAVTKVQDLRRRLYGIARLLEQMPEPIICASLKVAGLLGQTFFMPFALTTFSALARLRVLVQQALHDFVLVFNMLSACPLDKLEKDDNHFHEIPDFLDCKWDGMKFFLASMFTHQQQERTEKDYIQWFVEDLKDRKYDVLGSLMSDVEGDTAADSTGLPSKVFGESIQSAGFTNKIKEKDLLGLNSMASIGERTDASGNVHQPDVSIQEEERKGTSEDHCTGSMASISGLKKKVAYVSVLTTTGPETERLKEQNPHPQKQKKDALFDMLLGMGGKTHDTLF